MSFLHMFKTDDHKFAEARSVKSEHCVFSLFDFSVSDNYMGATEIFSADLETFSLYL